MKLIRLLSGGTDTSLFTANLRDNVKIKAGSKIALKSLSMEILDKNLVVDATNNTFMVQMGTNNIVGETNFNDQFKVVSLTQGTYTQTQLISEITARLNEVLSSRLYFSNNGDTQSQERTDLGFQWKADLDVSGGLLLGFDRSANEIVPSGDCVLNQMEGGISDNTFINSDNDPRIDEFSSSVLWDDPLCRGGFRAEFNIQGLQYVTPPNATIIGDGTKINYGQFFCGLLPFKYQDTLTIDEFMITCGSDWMPNNANPVFIENQSLNVVFPEAEAQTMLIGDYLAFDVYLGTYNVEEPVPPTELELQLNPIQDVNNFKVGDKLYITFATGGIIAGNKIVEVEAINELEGKILLDQPLDAQSETTLIQIYILQDTPYFREIMDIEFDGEWTATLDFPIHPNLDAYVVAKQNFVFYKVMNIARQFPINPDTGVPYKLTSNSSFLISRQNLNTNGIPTVSIQLKLSTDDGNKNYNLAQIPLAGNNILNQIVSNNSFYMGILTGLDTIQSGTNTLQNQYTMYGTIDAFINTNETTGEVTEVKVKDLNTIQYHKLKDIQPSVVSLNFLGSGIKTGELLGFKLQQYSLNNVADKFVAEYPLLQNAVPGDVLVEIQNIPFETYDSERGGRQNVVYIMNKADFESNILDNRFDSNIVFPIFMSINNAQELNLNSFTIRITSKGQPLKVKNNKDISVALLVED